MPGFLTPLCHYRDLSKRGVHGSGGSATHVWEHVALDVERKGDIRGLLELLHELGIYTLLQQEHGARVFRVWAHVLPRAGKAEIPHQELRKYQPLATVESTTSRAHGCLK